MKVEDEEVMMEVSMHLNSWRSGALAGLWMVSVFCRGSWVSLVASSLWCGAVGGS